MDTIRTFIAVETSAAVRQRAVELIERLRLSQADVKWVEPHHLHLTLKFLGDVPAANTADICGAIADVTQQLQPLEISFRGAGAFPDPHRPRTVWLGVDGGLEPLTELAAAIEQRLADLGYPREARHFHPHLTLGRVRGGGPTLRDLARLIRENTAFEAGLTEIHEVLTFASHLDRTGPTHEALSCARLGRAP